MALTNYLEEKFLNHLRGTTYTAPSGLYVKLHTADPGEDATSAAAGETTRKAATFNAAANPGGTMSLASAIEWTNVSTGETYSHFSVWDTVGPAGGNPLGYGPLNSSVTVAIGDTFRLTAATWTLA